MSGHAARADGLSEEDRRVLLETRVRLLPDRPLALESTSFAAAGIRRGDAFMATAVRAPVAPNLEIEAGGFARSLHLSSGAWFTARAQVFERERVVGQVWIGSTSVWDPLGNRQSATELGTSWDLLFGSRLRVTPYAAAFMGTDTSVYTVGVSSALRLSADVSLFLAAGGSTWSLNGIGGRGAFGMVGVEWRLRDARIQAGLIARFGGNPLDTFTDPWSRFGSIDARPVRWGWFLSLDLE